jgi:predicted nucleic acid-binding Zn ribbon protein
LGVLREPTYRLYNCQRCGVQVRICRRCDHGNIYCAQECSRIRRRECLRRAGARYQGLIPEISKKYRSG